VVQGLAFVEEQDRRGRLRIHIHDMLTGSALTRGWKTESCAKRMRMGNTRPLRKRLVSYEVDDLLQCNILKFWRDDLSLKKVASGDGF